jgi:GrpB-like predicted nucleotidyltransferase (UPF0157 family)
MKKLVLEDHNPQWAGQFLQLKNIYTSHLGPEIASVEHVGSTSIPGIKAKPILDIDIIVDDPARLPIVIHRLGELGYLHLGDLGIKGREAFRRVTTEVPWTHPRQQWPQHNLYVCQRGIDSLMNHLLFRDYLRAHPEKARQYSALKETLISTVNDDIDLYVEGKAEFITGILKEVGFDAPSITDIQEQNKKKS